MKITSETIKLEWHDASVLGLEKKAQEKPISSAVSLYTIAKQAVGRAAQSDIESFEHARFWHEENKANGDTQDALDYAFEMFKDEDGDMSVTRDLALITDELEETITSQLRSD